MSDILAEPLFDWFINIYRPSTFSCKEKKINNYSLSLYKPISFMKMSSEKIDIYFDTVYHTTLHYTARIFYSLFAATTFGFYFWN